METAKGDVRNDRKNPVTRFCLAMEEHRRTEAGRVRTARELVDFFFPRTGNGAEDRIFLHFPPPVRGPVVSSWGIRGRKSALRDSDDKVRRVVEDALAAGDIDEATFEDGIDAQTLIDWIPLPEWWAFWRTGKLTGVAIQEALATARDLALFDDRWFLLHVDGRGGKTTGTDTLCDTLSKDQIGTWMRKLHGSGDGSPAGLVSALGWEMVLAKTAQEALLFSLDAFASKVSLSLPHVAATAMPGAGEHVSVPPIAPLDAPAVEAPWADVSSINAPPPSELPDEGASKRPPVPGARKRV